MPPVIYWGLLRTYPFYQTPQTPGRTSFLMSLLGTLHVGGLLVSAIAYYGLCPLPTSWQGPTFWSLDVDQTGDTQPSTAICLECRTSRYLTAEWNLTAAAGFRHWPGQGRGITGITGIHLLIALTSAPASVLSACSSPILAPAPTFHLRFRHLLS